MPYDIRLGQFEAYAYTLLFPLMAIAPMSLPFGWRDKGGHIFTPAFCRSNGERMLLRWFDGWFMPAFKRCEKAARR